MIILGEFPVHNETYLKSNKTNSEDRVMEELAFSYGLSK